MSSTEKKKSYKIVINRDEKGDVKSRGYFMPADGDWDVEDYDVALDMLNCAARYFQKFRSIRYNAILKIQEEMEALVGGNHIPERGDHGIRAPEGGEDNPREGGGGSGESSGQDDE